MNKVITTDFNNDGWSNFIAVGEWTNIGLFLNERGNSKKVWVLSLTTLRSDGANTQNFKISEVSIDFLRCQKS